MSRSLRRLVITSCDSNYDEKRIQICVPRLVSLWLDNTEVRIDSHQDKCDCVDPIPMACYHVTRDGDTSDIDSDSDDHEEGSGYYTRKKYHRVRGP
jgi:hypothetical protein